MVAPALRAALLAATLLAAPAALAQTAPATPAAGDNPVMLRVNGKEFRRSDVEEAFQRLPPNAQQIPMGELLPRLLRDIAANHLLSTAGYKAKLQDSADVKADLKRVENDLVAQAFLRKEVDPKLTDAALQKKYEELIKQNPPQEEVRARHILLKTKEEADAVLKQIKGGADFEKLAAEKTTDPSGKENGGDLGYFTKDLMVPEFADAAFKMKPGQVSDAPVKSEFGFHIIKVEDRRQQNPISFEQAKPQIRSLLAREEAQAYVQGLVEKAKLELFDMSGQPLKDTGAAPAPEKKP